MNEKVFGKSVKLTGSIKIVVFVVVFVIISSQTFIGFDNFIERLIVNRMKKILMIPVYNRIIYLSKYLLQTIDETKLFIEKNIYILK